MAEAAKIKRVPNPPQKCIFCGGGDISKEHLFARWMRQYIQEKQGSIHILVQSLVDLDTSEVETASTKGGKLNRPGDFRSRGLRVVCKDCNNGWMSRLQAEAKEHLAPLLAGSKTDIENKAQVPIATWSAMFAIVLEHADIATACVSQPARSRFMSTLAPPKDWIIWIAPFSGDMQDGAAFHRGFGVQDEQDVAVRYEDRPHLSLFAAGRLLFVVFGSEEEPIVRFHAELRRHAAQRGLVRVWPPVKMRSRIVLDQRRTIGDQDFWHLLNGLTGIIVSALEN